MAKCELVFDVNMKNYLEFKINEIRWCADYLKEHECAGHEELNFCADMFEKHGKKDETPDK